MNILKSRLEKAPAVPKLRNIQIRFLSDILTNPAHVGGGISSPGQIDAETADGRTRARTNRAHISD
ncbi:MAG: hypothetical protein ACU0DI_05505, partial [Paracoccaceae bacterium]